MSCTGENKNSLGLASVPTNEFFFSPEFWKFGLSIFYFFLLYIAGQKLSREHASDRMSREKQNKMENHSCRCTFSHLLHGTNTVKYINPKMTDWQTFVNCPSLVFTTCQSAAYCDMSWIKIVATTQCWISIFRLSVNAKQLPMCISKKFLNKVTHIPWPHFWISLSLHQDPWKQCIAFTERTIFRGLENDCGSACTTLRTAIPLSSRP